MSKMSRREFELLANVIRDEDNEDMRERLINRIGKICQEENDRFRWGTWRRACGGAEELGEE